jgi:DNA-binding transcriptional regulator YiaG
MTPKQIRDLRKKMGLSQDQFAEWSGLTGRGRSRSVYFWEKGKLRPSVNRLKRMLEELHSRYGV